MNLRKSATIVSALLLTIAAGCNNEVETPEALPPLVSAPAAGQQTYNSPADAVAAVASAAQTGTRAALLPVFGPPPRELLSGDPVADENDFKSFIQSCREGLDSEISPSGNTARLLVGKDRWPSPIPLVKLPSGQWYFDSNMGVDRVLARRIGSNELRTIETCRQYILAQREYASLDRDDDGVLQYAQHFISTPGRHDGLYWESTGPNDTSPLDALVVASADEGYHPQAGVKSPYHGYYLRILKSQGPHAPGGEYSYIINGRMIAGCAMIAYPARYGSSGIMTFIVNHQGQVYQKDLGRHTQSAVTTIHSYDPDPTWTLVKD